MGGTSHVKSIIGLESNVDLLAPEHLEDPYPLFATLRDHSPVAWHPRLQMWLVTRYEHCAAILADRRFGKESRLSSADTESAEPMPEALRALTEIRDRWFLRRDPPHHTRLKAPVRSALSAEAVARLRPTITATIEMLLDRTSDRDTMDVIHDLAAPLPVSMMLHLLGDPAIEIPRLLSWSQELMHVAEPEYRRQESPGAAWSLGHDLTRELMQQLRESLGRARARPRRDDLLGYLLHASDRGALDDEELLATCALLLFGGSGTTIDLIGNCVLALLAHPEALHRLRREPTLVAAAVDETLRYDPPLQMCTRVAHDDVHVGDQLIRAGEWVGILLGSAGRDPRHFASPDEFRLDRQDGAHLAFGRGHHHCPGMMLAREEAIEAIGALLRRRPGLTKDSRPPRRRATFVFRGVAELPVRFG